MRIIAKLDVKPPYVVKPVHFEGLRKVGCPQALAEKYYRQGADEILYIDIVASLYRREVLFEQVQETVRDIFIPFAVGGGVTDLEDMTRLFHCGADKIAINTHLVQQRADLLDEASKLFGSQSVVLNIEAKHWDGSWECYSDCGRQRSGRDVIAWVKEAEQRGAGEVVIQSVDRDGRRCGFDIDLLGEVKAAVGIPVVAASGAGSVSDIVTLCRQVPVDAVAVASVLHYDTTTIADIKRELQQSGIEVAG